MMFLGIVRGDMQNIIKIGSKFGPPGSKKGYLSHFPPIFAVLFTFLRNGAKTAQKRR